MFQFINNRAGWKIYKSSPNAKCLDLNQMSGVMNIQFKGQYQEKLFIKTQEKV